MNKGKCQSCVAYLLSKQLPASAIQQICTCSHCEINYAFKLHVYQPRKWSHQFSSLESGKVASSVGVPEWILFSALPWKEPVKACWWQAGIILVVVLYTVLHWIHWLAWYVTSKGFYLTRIYLTFSSNFPDHVSHLSNDVRCIITSHLGCALLGCQQMHKSVKISVCTGLFFFRVGIALIQC